MASEDEEFMAMKSEFNMLVLMRIEFNFPWSVGGFNNENSPLAVVVSVHVVDNVLNNLEMVAFVVVDGLFSILEDIEFFTSGETRSLFSDLDGVHVCVLRCFKEGCIKILIIKLSIGLV